MNFNKIQESIDDTNTKTIEYNANTFIVANHEENGKNLFININNTNGNTILDFSKAYDYIVLCYDTIGELKSRHYAIKSKGSFMIQTPYNSIHLVLLDTISNKNKYNE